MLLKNYQTFIQNLNINFYVGNFYVSIKTIIIVFNENFDLFSQNTTVNNYCSNDNSK